MPRSGIMLCYPFEESRLKTWPRPWIVQPKLDGERCRVLSKDGYIMLLSSEENPFHSVPHIQKEAEKVCDLLGQNFELDGELYVHGWSHSEIHSVVSRTVNLHENYTSMELHLFDLIDLRTTQALRLTKLNALKAIFSNSSPIKIVESKIVSTMEALMDLHRQWKLDGYEGFVIRHPYAIYQRKRTVTMMKFKPRKTDRYKIVGFKEEISIDGERKGALGALVCQSNESESLFSVGSGFSRRLREELWKRRDSLIGKMCVVRYQHVTSRKKIPRFPIFFDIEEEE